MAEEGKTGAIVWTMRSPYIFVGGNWSSTGPAEVRDLAGWADMGRDWPRSRQVFWAIEAVALCLSPEMPVVRTSRLRNLRIVNDLQMAPLTLPRDGCRQKRVHLHRSVAW